MEKNMQDSRSVRAESSIKDNNDNLEQETKEPSISSCQKKTPAYHCKKSVEDTDKEVESVEEESDAEQHLEEEMEGSGESDSWITDDESVEQENDAEHHLEEEMEEYGEEEGSDESDSWSTCSETQVSKFGSDDEDIGMKNKKYAGMEHLAETDENFDFPSEKSVLVHTTKPLQIEELHARILECLDPVEEDLKADDSVILKSMPVNSNNRFWGVTLRRDCYKRTLIQRGDIDLAGDCTMSFHHIRGKVKKLVITQRFIITALKEIIHKCSTFGRIYEYCVVKEKRRARVQRSNNAKIEIYMTVLYRLPPHIIAHDSISCPVHVEDA